MADPLERLRRRCRDLEREGNLLRAERDRFRLENLALAAQLTAFLHARARPRITDTLRAYLVRLAQASVLWKSLVHIVQPRTVLLWHRKGFRYWWRWKSRPPGRPRVDPELRKLVRKLAYSNPLWGAPRIHGEICKLGIAASERTVSRLMPRGRNPGAPMARQRWRTFLANHLPDIVAADLFTVPTAAFRILYVLLVVDLGRRRILHLNLTEHPTQDWAAQQIVEAFPGTLTKRYLLRDRDGVYGPVFRRRVKRLGLKEILCAPDSPWQNGYAERVIGSVRRDLLDHVIVIDERHLRRLLRQYADYYNAKRTHLSLNKDSPDGRPVHGHKRGRRIIEIPHLGGLHHHYERRAA